MIKKILLILLLINVFSSMSGQEVKLPPFALSGIEFDLLITNLPDSLSKLHIAFTDDDKKLEIDPPIIDGKVSKKILIDNAGTYKIEISGTEISSVSIRIIPGWFSILPPLIAILLALIIRQVLVSLAVGIYFGAVFIYDYNPFIAFLRLADVFILNALVDNDHMIVIVFTLLIGGVIGIISRNGGTVGLANLITKFARTPRSGMISSWLMGIVVFFDDYANTLIIGNMMRPITDKLRISREKLAYIVDSTAAPIASIVIISTWIGYELGLISDGLVAIGSNENAYDVFIRTLPYRFYPIAALFFVFITSYFQHDFGPMYDAEKRARVKGKLFAEGSIIKELKDDDFDFKSPKNRWYNSAIPILIILIGTIIGLIYTGKANLNSQGISDYSIQNIISSSNSFLSLLWASFAACIIAIVMSVSQKILSLNDAVNAWSKGAQAMLFACIILTFAWAISTVTQEMKTADYIISILSDKIDPRFLPVLVFIVCGLISFATGTSWGTMAIVMPIVIPLTFKISELAGFDSMDTQLIIHGVVSSVLAGSVFGDHCSPIADTTILSSMASQCNHIDHVKTQLPYALVVAFVCMLFGDIPTAFGLNPFVAWIFIFTALILIVKYFGKRVPNSTPA